MDALDAILTGNNADAYVMYASSQDPDMRYLTGFATSDPFVYYKQKGRRGTIIVSQMEYSRALHESKTAVMTRTSAGLPEILKQEQDPWKATALMIAGQVTGSVLVPPHFPLALARALSPSCPVIVDDHGLASQRAIKTRREIRLMRHVQTCTERAMARARTIIRKSRVRKDVLFMENEPLTSERVKSEMHKQLIDLGCRATDTIVACAKDSAIPHAMGSGPLLADQPIVIDLFPQDERSGYYSDMTRTVVRGEPEAEIKHMYEAVRDAQELAVTKIRAGAMGGEIHQQVIDLFSERGYENGIRGFVHNLGHGIGLQVHEAPSLGPSGGRLSAGNVITVEPGLYYPKIGGVRLEDIGMVTTRGFSRFTRCPVEMVL